MPKIPPQSPLFEIVPPKGWISLNLREMWQFRDLLFFLTWRDIQVKYKQTLLGFAWAIIVPFLTMVIFGTIFGKVAKMSTNGVNPYLFYIAATVPWQFFANAITMSGNSLVGNVNLLTKVYLPRVFIPLAAILAQFVDLAISFALLVIMMFLMGHPPDAAIVFIPCLIFLIFATALGVGLMLAALNVKYHDIRYVIPFLTQIWMYCSVLIPFSSVPKTIWGVSIGAWRYLYALNPMVGVIEGCRWCLMGGTMKVPVKTETVYRSLAEIPESVRANMDISIQVVDGLKKITLVTTDLRPVDPPFILLAVGLPVTTVLLLFGLYYYKRMEKMFADVV